MPFYHVLPHRERNNRLKIIAGVTRSVASGANRTTGSKSGSLSKKNRGKIVSLYPDNRSNQGELISL